MDIKFERKNDKEEVEALLDLAFGKDRFKKAAYALREGVDPIAELSFVIRDDEKLIASLRFWPAQINGLKVLLLGPIAVLPELQGKGYGIGLMKHGLAEAKKLGYERVVLVGDEAYYRRVGFSRDLARYITMDGQKDESRILGHELVEGALNNVKGMILKE